MKSSTCGGGSAESFLTYYIFGIYTEYSVAINTIFSTPYSTQFLYTCIRTLATLNYDTYHVSRKRKQQLGRCWRSKQSCAHRDQTQKTQRDPPSPLNISLHLPPLRSTCNMTLASASPLSRLALNKVVHRQLVVGQAKHQCRRGRLRPSTTTLYYRGQLGRKRRGYLHNFWLGWFARLSAQTGGGQR